MTGKYDTLAPARYSELPHIEPMRRRDGRFSMPPKDSKSPKKRRKWSRESVRTLFCR